MFILIYFIIVAISQFAANKILGISDEVEESYSFSKRDSIILAVLFLVGIIAQILVPKISPLKSAYWGIVLGYAVISLIIMMVFMTIKKSKVEEQRKEIQQVYEILQKMVDKKGEGLDYNKVPFKLGYKYGNINKIDVEVEPTSFDEKVLSIILQQLNSFLPNFTWGYELHLEERYMTFVGNDKPPNMARWAGSWLKHFREMPLGISGKGEVSWVIDAVPKSRRYHSQYKDEKGNYIPEDTTLPRQPQSLISGAPLGLNTVIPTTKGYKTMATIEVGDMVFDINNKPVKVVEVHDILIPDKVYSLTFASGLNTINVISDKIHKFPKELKSAETFKNKRKLNVGYAETSAEELKLYTDRVLGSTNNILESYGLIAKDEVSIEPVRCIKVNSENHLFLITDTQEPLWSGGNIYPYKALYTRNTGGGKAIYIEQIIE